MIILDPLEHKKWHLFERWLRPVAEKGDQNWDDCLHKFRAGHTVLWNEGVNVLALDNAADGACVVWLGRGFDVRNWWNKAQTEVARFALQNGCFKLRIEGRKGWKRILQPHWTLIEETDREVVLELELMG